MAALPGRFQLWPKSSAEGRRDLRADIREKRLFYLEKLFILYARRQAAAGDAMVWRDTPEAYAVHADVRTCWFRPREEGTVGQQLSLYPQKHWHSIQVRYRGGNENVTKQ